MKSKNHVLRALALALLAVLPSVAQTDGKKGEVARTRDYNSEMFFATLEGLYRDGVANEDVDRILLVDPESREFAFFVPGCPICIPVLEACRVYRSRIGFVSYKINRDTLGGGLPAKVSARLRGQDLGIARTEVEALIARWQNYRFDSLKMSDAERHEWRSQMEMMAKQGGLMMERGAKTKITAITRDKGCAICEGALTGASDR